MEGSDISHQAFRQMSIETSSLMQWHAMPTYQEGPGIEVGQPTQVQPAV